MNKAVFFDRDGIINLDKQYVHKVEDFFFFPEVFDTLKWLREKGYILILITNQSGIARGYYTVEKMETLHQYMQNELCKHAAEFDEIFYCPHHPNGIIPKYSFECKCRKPGKQLFERAIQKYKIDPQKSIAIGDNDRDLIPAEQIGMKCIKISDCYDDKWITCTRLDEIKRYIEET